MLALALVLLPLSLSGCTKFVKQLEQTEVPEYLTAETPLPEIQGSTWKDVGVFAAECKFALESCNTDKWAIEVLLKGEKDDDKR